MTAMVSHDATARATPRPRWVRLCARAQAVRQDRVYARISATSITKTIHSVNHAQKKTRISEPIAAGFTRLVDSQIPTPVSAPRLVVTMKPTNRIRYARRSHWSSPVRIPSHSRNTTRGARPTASMWLIRTCTVAMTAMRARLPRTSR